MNVIQKNFIFGLIKEVKVGTFRIYIPLPQPSPEALGAQWYANITPYKAFFSFLVISQ